MNKDLIKSEELIFSDDVKLVKNTLNDSILFEKAAKESFFLVDTNKDNKKTNDEKQ